MESKVTLLPHLNCTLIFLNLLKMQTAFIDGRVKDVNVLGNTGNDLLTPHLNEPKPARLIVFVYFFIAMKPSRN